MARKTGTDALLKELREFGLAYPEAHLKSPWPGHLDLAVKDKTFAYLSVEGQPFSMSCKLPLSNSAALMLPFASPTGYGLGKSGWVTLTPSGGQIPPVDVLKAWIDESYRAQAPKKLVATLSNTNGAVQSATKRPSAKRNAVSAKAKPRAPKKTTAKAKPKTTPKTARR